MADQLYLNLWFPSFAEDEMLPRMLSVLKEFPYSVQRPGVAFLSIHSVSWQEPAVFEQSFDYGTDPEHALSLAQDFVHSDNAYSVDVYWDLHVPEREGDLDEKWGLQPQRVQVIAFGTDFDDAAHQQEGHIQVDFGLDAPFLHEELEYTPAVEVRVKANVRRLVSFIQAVEKNCGISGRLLWSEGEGTLAHKLIARLQKVQ